jgi:molecular chaperone GrpE (heat shock protein)
VDEGREQVEAVAAESLEATESRIADVDFELTTEEPQPAVAIEAAEQPAPAPPSDPSGRQPQTASSIACGDETAAEPVAAELAGLAVDVANVSRRIDELVRLADRREQLIDRLHADNQRLRAGELAQVRAPLLREMIRTYDLVVTLLGDGSSAGSDLELVRRRLVDGLESGGTLLVEPEAGEAFDAALHTAIERVETCERELDMTVARTVRVGFIQDGERVLRPADVVVHLYRKDAGSGPDAVDSPIGDWPDNTGGGTGGR